MGRSWFGHGLVIAWSWLGHCLVMAWSWLGHGVVMCYVGLSWVGLQCRCFDALQQRIHHRSRCFDALVWVWSWVVHGLARVRHGWPWALDWSLVWVCHGSLGWSRVVVDRSRFGNGSVMGLATVRFGHWFGFVTVRFGHGFGNGSVRSLVSVGPRRQDLIALDGNIKVHAVNPSEERQRNFLEVRFKELTTAAGASTPCEWKVVVHHTRSGSKHSGMQIPRKTAEKRLRFKKSIFKAALDVAVKDHRRGVPGFVVGDLNIVVQHAREVLRSVPADKGNFDLVGGQGGPWRVSCV